MAAVAPGPIGPAERLSATLVLSLVAFGVLILGVGFARDAAAPVTPTLDVILTETRSDEAPEDADFIAQANNQGGGDQDRAQRPREEQLAPVPKPDPGLSPDVLIAQAPPPEPEPTPRLLTTTGASDRALPLPKDQRDTEPSALPQGRELIEQNMEMARLAAEIERRQQLLAKRPRRKFVTASTREYEYAAYLRAWVAKVERVGNLNYPEAARRQGIYGSLKLTVSIYASGKIEKIEVDRSSGSKVLDAAAVRIVELAAPYAPFPADMQKKADILSITRTWTFTRSDQLVGTE